MVRSVNGAAVTVIQGYRIRTDYGDSAVRCVYLANGAALGGFHSDQRGSQRRRWRWRVVRIRQCGRVQLCADRQLGWLRGGGANGGTLNNCTLTGNSAAYDGGGASGSTLNNCTLTGNSATTAAAGRAIAH